MNPDDPTPPPETPPSAPSTPIPWRVVGFALAGVAGAVAAGLWWNHHQDKLAKASPPSLPPPSVVLDPRPAAEKEAPPLAASPVDGPLTPLAQPSTPSPAPAPSVVEPSPPQRPAAPTPAQEEADRQARWDKYTALRAQVMGEKSGSSALPPPLPAPAAFPETVAPVPPASPSSAEAAAVRPSAPLPPTPAGEMKFVPGSLHSVREAPAASFSLPDIAGSASGRAAAAAPEEDGGVPEEGPGLKSIDFGGVAPDGTPAARIPPAPLPFALLSRVMPSPWDRGSELVFIGLQEVAPAQVARPRANIVFLVDDSISMGDPGKIPLLREAVSGFIDRLEPDDRVALVAYAGDSSLLLPSTPVRERDTIRAAFGPSRLAAVATGRPGASLQIAYSLAQQNFVKDGFNRVIAVTDGDLNLGVGEEGGLYDYVSRHARDGITLSIVGVGPEYASGPKVRELIRAGKGRASAARSAGGFGLALDKEIVVPPSEGVRDLRFGMPFQAAGVDAWRLLGYRNRLPGAGFLAVYEVRKKAPDGNAAPSGAREMNLRFRRESAAADEILSQSLDSGSPAGLDPRIWSEFNLSVGEAGRRLEGLSSGGSIPAGGEAGAASPVSAPPPVPAAPGTVGDFQRNAASWIETPPKSGP